MPGSADKSWVPDHPWTPLPENKRGLAERSRASHPAGRELRNRDGHDRSHII